MFSEHFCILLRLQTVLILLRCLDHVYDCLLKIQFPNPRAQITLRVIFALHRNIGQDLEVVDDVIQ